MVSSEKEYFSVCKWEKKGDSLIYYYFLGIGTRHEITLDKSFSFDIFLNV